jgi:KDO2-lipid IV(A) lauroyltransferase
MRTLLRFLALLPLAVLHGIASAAGWLLWVRGNKRRATALRNLERCLPELDLQQRRRIAYASIAHEMKTYAEAPLIWFGNRRRILGLTHRFNGIEMVDSLLAGGKGLILLTPHLGAFEACAMPFAARHPITGLYKPQKGKLEAIVLEGRNRFGATMISTAGGGSREKLLPVLARNETAYFIPDQDPPEGRGVFAPFFKIAAHTPVLVQRLIQASGAPVIFFTGERLSRGRGFVGHFREAPPAIYDADMLVSTTAMNACVEAMIREYPEQYWWGHKRFRRRPEGEPAFYGEVHPEEVAVSATGPVAAMTSVESSRS